MQFFPDISFIWTDYILLDGWPHIMLALS